MTCEIPPGQLLRVLVIGAGPAAVAMHLPVLARLRDGGKIELAVVCDLDGGRARAARRQFGFLEESGDALAAMRRQDIQAVYIFASAQLHHVYGLAALREGKHLFVEKPIAPSYADAIELVQAARAGGLVAVGGHNRRFYNSLATVKARAGKVTWRFAEAVFHKPEFGKPPLFGAHTWLGANGIHGLDALVYMMGGVPEQLTAFAGEAGSAPPSAFSAIMRWPDGAQGVFLCNNSAGSRREEYVFHGLGETFRVTDGGVSIEKGGTVVNLSMESIGDGVEAEHVAFLAAIRGVAAPHGIESLAPSLFLAELVEAGFSGRVKLPAPRLPISPVVVKQRAPVEPAILVSHSIGMNAALMRLVPRYRLVSLEELSRAPGARPDIVAAILGRGSCALPADVLDKLPALAVVGVAGLSLARHAPEDLNSRGIALVNASQAYAGTVAEFALGLAILARRRSFTSHEVMRAGGWGTRRGATGLRALIHRSASRLRPTIAAAGLEDIFLRTWRVAKPLAGVSLPAAGHDSRDLRGATVGLIGWSANARAFTDRLVCADARVLVYSEHASEDHIAAVGATKASLAEVLAADIVSLHRGMTAQTHHFLGAAELARLRPGAVLINVARGALIEPAALLARLQQGDIFACLDTYEDEPLSPRHELRRLANVFLTSHIAGGSSDMHAAAAQEVVRKVLAHLAGDSAHAIDPQQLQTMT